MSNRTPIPVVGIVGGIGSGKSTVARQVAAHRNVLLIQGDEVGHEVLTFPDVRDAVRQRFGQRVIGSDQQIDRRELGRLVFGTTAEHQQARRDLERIVHPRIREIFTRNIATAGETGCSAVLLDAAVLFEAGWNDLCHAVAFIDVPADLRLGRLKDRGWDEAELERRESSQAPLETKRSRAQITIDNSRSIAEAARQLDDFLTHLLAEDHS